MPVVVLGWHGNGVNSSATRGAAVAGLEIAGVADDADEPAVLDDPEHAMSNVAIGTVAIASVRTRSVFPLAGYALASATSMPARGLPNPVTAS